MRERLSVATEGVTILKKDTSVRICRKYKQSAKPSNPIPRLEDALTKIAESIIFNPRDMSHMDKPLVLAEVSQVFVTPHKGPCNDTLPVQSAAE